MQMGMFNGAVATVPTAKRKIALSCNTNDTQNLRIWSEEKVFSMAGERGLYALDKLYRLNPSPMDRPGQYTQRHARRNTSAWWVFRK